MNDLETQSKSQSAKQSVMDFPNCDSQSSEVLTSVEDNLESEEDDKEERRRKSIKKEKNQVGNIDDNAVQNTLNEFTTPNN